MNEDVKQIIEQIANVENAELIAKLTEAIGQTEEALRAKDDELRKTKEKMIEYALRAVGTEKEEDEEAEDPTEDEIFEAWARDPKGEYEKTIKKGK